MKILHLSFHKGCQNDIQYICNKLNLDLTFQKFTDGVTKDNEIYNITNERAKIAWNNYKDFYNKFDCIITSDTAPISRVFLQNNWDKKLIIWVCNRFDYAHGSKSGFPDKEYYNLMREAKNRPNVTIMGYTPFENYYAKFKRGCDIGDKVIKPIGNITEIFRKMKKTKIENKNNKLFVGSYHNENIMMDLTSKLKELNLDVYHGRYNGPLDLSEFKGVVHIPYAWNNLALFEGLQAKIIYFIPSELFLRKLSKMDKFWFQDRFCFDRLDLCEWYCDEHKDLFVYFESWEDLKFKVNNLNYDEKKKIIEDFSKKFENETLNKWKKILL